MSSARFGGGGGRRRASESSCSSSQRQAVARRLSHVTAGSSRRDSVHMAVVSPPHAHAASVPHHDRASAETSRANKKNVPQVVVRFVYSREMRQALDCLRAAGGSGSGEAEHGLVYVAHVIHGYPIILCHVTEVKKALEERERRKQARQQRQREQKEREKKEKHLSRLTKRRPPAVAAASEARASLSRGSSRSGGGSVRPK